MKDKSHKRKLVCKNKAELYAKRTKEKVAAPSLWKCDAHKTLKSNADVTAGHGKEGRGKAGVWHRK